MHTRDVLNFRTGKHHSYFGRLVWKYSLLRKWSRFNSKHVLRFRVDHTILPETWVWKSWRSKILATSVETRGRLEYYESQWKGFYKRFQKFTDVVQKVFTNFFELSSTLIRFLPFLETTPSFMLTMFKPVRVGISQNGGKKLQSRFDELLDSKQSRNLLMILSRRSSTRKALSQNQQQSHGSSQSRYAKSHVKNAMSMSWPIMMALTSTQEIQRSSGRRTTVDDIERRAIARDGEIERKNAMPQVWRKRKGSLGDRIPNQQKTFEDLTLLKNKNNNNNSHK